MQILTYDETFAYGINPDAFLGKQEERLQGSRSPDLPRRVAKPRRGR